MLYAVQYRKWSGKSVTNTLTHSVGQACSSLQSDSIGAVTFEPFSLSPFTSVQLMGGVSACCCLLATRWISPINIQVFRTRLLDRRVMSAPCECGACHHLALPVFLGGADDALSLRRERHVRRPACCILMRAAPRGTPGLTCIHMSFSWQRTRAVDAS